MLRLKPTINKLAFRMRQDIPALRDWDHDDLVQEAFLRLFMSMEGFRGESSLKTWAVSTVRNNLIQQARHLAHRPTAIGDAGEFSGRSTRYEDSGHRLVLRSQTKRLLGWLRSNPDGIDQGWAVLNLLLKTQGDFNYTSLALSVHTGQPWTVERVRNVVRAIRSTAHGQALCESLGIIRDNEE